MQVALSVLAHIGPAEQLVGEDSGVGIVIEAIRDGWIPVSRRPNLELAGIRPISNAGDEVTVAIHLHVCAGPVLFEQQHARVVLRIAGLSINGTDAAVKHTIIIFPVWVCTGRSGPCPTVNDEVPVVIRIAQVVFPVTVIIRYILEMGDIGMRRQIRRRGNL